MRSLRNLKSLAKVASLLIAISADAGETVLNSNAQLQLSQQYADLNRTYEYKQKAGTLTLADQINHYNAMGAFSQGVLSNIKDYQASIYRDRTLTAAKENSALVEVARVGRVPAMVVGGIWALWNGVSYTVGPVTPGVSVKNKNASLKTTSALISAMISADPQGITSTLSRGLVEHISLNYTNICGQSPDNTVSLNYGISL